MTDCFSKKTQLWEGIRKNYTNKLSKLEEREYYLRSKLDAMEKVMDNQDDPCKCKNDRKPSFKEDLQLPMSSDPCGFGKKQQPKQISSDCICDPCAYKSKYPGKDCRCGSKPGAGTSKQSPCSCGKQAKQQQPKCSCDEKKLAELLDIIEEAAPDVLANNVKVPCPGKPPKPKSKCNDSETGDLENVVKQRIMPIIDEMLEDFCDCCEDVQHIFDPLHSKHNCSCLSMLEISSNSISHPPGCKCSKCKQDSTKHDANCKCDKCVCSPCSKTNNKSSSNNCKCGPKAPPSKPSQSSNCKCGPKASSKIKKPKCVCESPKGGKQAKCECIECVCETCTPNSDGSQIMNCECPKCSCDDCAMMVPSNCQCNECVCDPCGADNDHPPGCKCNECQCKPCPTKKDKDPCGPDNDHPPGCKCNESQRKPCPPTMKDKDPCDTDNDHPPGCKCDECQCKPCHTMKDKNSKFKDCGCDPCTSKATFPKPMPKKNSACGCGSPPFPKRQPSRGSKIPVYKGCICKDPCPCGPCYFDPCAIKGLEKSITSGQNSDLSCLCGPPPRKMRQSSMKKPINAVSSLSLKSVDVCHMKDIINMYNKQKEVRRRIKELESKQQYYDSMMDCR